MNHFSDRVRCLQVTDAADPNAQDVADGITRLTVRPTDYGTLYLVDPDDIAMAGITQLGESHVIHIYDDGIDFIHRGAFADAVRWAEQALAELEHVDRTGTEPDYGSVPASAAWPKVKTTATLADALEALVADLREFDLEIPCSTMATLNIHVMDFKSESDTVQIRGVHGLIAGLSLPEAVDRNLNQPADANPMVHYGSPLSEDSVHRGGLPVDIVTLFPRSTSTI